MSLTKKGKKASAEKVSYFIAFDESGTNREVQRVQYGSNTTK